MPNIKITDLPNAILPMDLTETFFEVQTVEAGIPVSRRASGDMLTFTTDDVIKGTSSDDPSNPGGVFDGSQTWRNFLNQQTASVGFAPSGDDFVIQNFAEGGEISLRVRDGTEHLLTQDYGVTIPTTGAIRVPVGLTSEEPAPVDGQIRYDSDTNRFRGVISGVWADLDTTVGSLGLNDLNDVTLTAPDTGGVLYKSAGDWLDTDAIVINPAGEVSIKHNTATMWSTQDGGVWIYGEGDSTAGVGPSRHVAFLDVSLAAAGILGFFDDASDTLYVQNQVHGGHVLLTGETTGGTANIQLVRGDPDAGVTLYDTDVPKLNTASGGIDVLGSVATAPSSGGVQNTAVVLENSGGTIIGYLGFSAEEELTISNAVHGGRVDITAQQAAGATVDLVTFDPDGGMNTFWAGDPLITSTVDGFDLTADRPYIDMISDTAGQEVVLGFRGNSVGGMKMVWAEASSSGFIRLTTTSGANGDLFIQMIKDSMVRLFYNGTIHLETADEGVDIVNALAGDTIFDVIGVDTDNDGIVGVRGDSGGARFYWDESALIARIAQTDLDGVLEEDWITMTDNGAVGLGFNGTERLATTADGADVFGTVFDVVNVANTGASIHVRDSDSGARFNADGTFFTISQTSGAGALEDTWIRCAQDGGVEVRFNNQNAMRTVIAASGGLEVNNTVTGGGFERVLTTADLGGGAVALNDLTDVTITAPATGGVLYKSAGDWLDTDTILIDPGVDVEMNVNLRFQKGNALVLFNDASDVAQGLVGSSSADMFLDNLVNSQMVSIRNRDAGSTQRVSAEFTANEQTLFHIGLERLRTQTDGVDVESNQGVTVFDVISVTASGDISVGLRGQTNGGMRLFYDEGLTRGFIQQTAFTGVLEDTWITLNENAGVGINHNDIEMARTVAIGSGGLEVNNTVTGAGFERVLTVSDIGGGSPFAEVIITNSNLLDLVDTDIALNIGAADPDANPHLELGLFSLGAGIQAKATDTTADTMYLQPLGGDVFMGPTSAAVAGGCFLRDSNGATHGNVLETVPSGIIVEGHSGSNTIIDFHSVASSLAWRFQWDGGFFVIASFNAGAEFRINGQNTGAATREFIHMDPDAEVEIFDPLGDAAVFRTTAPASGGVTVNNTSTGAGFERVLTTSDLGGVAFPLDADDNDQIRFGTGQDMLQFFDGTDMQFNAVAGVDFIFIGGTGGAENMLSLIADGSVELYENGVLKVQTTVSGCDVLGQVLDQNNSGSALGTVFRIRNQEGGFEILVDGDDTTLSQTASNAGLEDTLIKFFNNDRTEFYFNGTLEADTQLHNTDYQTSGLRVKDHAGNLIDVGFNLMPVIELDTNTTLDETHVSQMLHRDNTGAVLYTLPSGTTGAVPPVGSLIMMTNENATGAHTIAASGTLRWLEGTGTPSTGTRTLAEGGVATAYHYSDTEWWIWGIGLS